MPRPLRTSCNRCHSQKLRCPKEADSSTCTRCAKAGASCVFSPAGPSARRALAAPAYENYVPFATPPMEDGLNMDFGWPSLDFNSPLSSTLPAPSPCAPQATAVTGTDCSLTDPASICARQLSELSVDIDRVHCNIPSFSMIHVSKNDPISELTKAWAEKYSQRQCLEQLFASAQQLLDVYPRAMGLIFKPECDQAEDCNDTTCIHRQDVPSELEDSFTIEEGKRMPIDLFLLNLLILCHTRLSDILDKMLVHVQTCAKATLALPSLREPEFNIPELRVGTFVASPEASSTMQLVLLAHITSVLADRAKQLNERVNDVTKEESSKKQARLVQLQCEILVEGADSKVIALQKVRSILNNLGFMRGLQPI